jgi:hypothetical protein
MINVIHSAEPLELAERGYRRYVDMLWQGRVEERWLVLEFYNLAGAGSVSPKRTPALAAVERIGGKWIVQRAPPPMESVRTAEGRDFVCTALYVPLLSDMLRES